MNVSAIDAWRLNVGVGPAEHGVYVNGYLYLAPTFRDEFWKVEPETGAILEKYRMPGHVLGRPTSGLVRDLWRFNWGRCDKI